MNRVIILLLLISGKIMKNSAIQICDATIQPGEKTTLALPLPEQYSCSPLYMPIKVINGKKKGPCLLLFSMIDGDEFNGMEILNQLFDCISAEDLSGTLITIPALNIYGLTHFPKMTPSGISLVNCFPGDETGNFGERVAHTFTQNILKHADYCIEYLTGSLNHEILPQIYCDVQNKKIRALAKVFQAPVVTQVESNKSTLRETIEALNVPLFVYQAGEASRFDHSAIKIGLEGTQYMMNVLQMLSREIDDDFSPVFSKDEDWLTSPASGILHTGVSLGEHVKKGDILGRLNDPFSNENSTIIKSSFAGIIVGINRTPLIQEGAFIFKLASFIDNEKAESIIEEWDEARPEQEYT